MASIPSRTVVFGCLDHSTGATPTPRLSRATTFYHHSVMEGSDTWPLPEVLAEARKRTVSIDFDSEHM